MRLDTYMKIHERYAQIIPVQTPMRRHRYPISIFLHTTPKKYTSDLRKVTAFTKLITHYNPQSALVLSFRTAKTTARHQRAAIFRETN